MPLRFRSRAAVPAALPPAELLESRRLLAGVTVTTADDLNDGDTSSIANLLANPGPSGISLREAIAAANNTPGADVVNFNIPGAGPHTVQLGSTLPFITDTLTINGYTQPGAVANTLALGNNATIKIELRAGSTVGLGLNLRAPNCEIRGLSMTGFDFLTADFAAAILLRAPGAIVEGNWIGVRPDGTVSGNTRGIRGTDEAPGALVGGTTPAARNVISGNLVAGVDLEGAGSSVVGNYIGTTISGTGAAPNGAGVFINGSHITVGGAGIGARNVISGNNEDGVRARGEGHKIEGNFIGPGANGEPLGNGGDGVRLLSPLVSDRIIRVGSEKDPFNAPVIAHNSGHGVNIAQGNAAVGQVAIHNNGGEGIKLGNAGFGSLTLTSATTTPAGTVITGTISGVQPGDGFVVTFYGNTEAGEHEAAIGSGFFQADTNGIVNINATIPACGLPRISAIADRDELADFGTSLSAVSLPIANNRPPVIEITTTAGSGAGSIVAAFTAAANTPGPEVILLNIPGTGFIDITPTQPLIPMFGLNNGVLFEGRGQGFGSVVPRTYINVNNGLGTFNGDSNNTVAGIGFFNVSGRAFDAVNGNNTLIHSTVGLGAAEQPLSVASIVQSDVVRILGGSNNRILSNAIHAGRSNACVAVFGGTGHIIQNNRIGITPSGVVLGGTSTTNNRVGVVINDGTGTDVIDNTIAGMINDAFKVGEFGFPGGSGHTFAGNRLFQNLQLGIDLADNGATPNDGPGDPDSGPNNLQNYPVIVSAEQVLSGVRITGNFVSGLNMLYSAEAFASSATPAINLDEGGRSLGTFNIATDGSGSAAFDLTVPGGAIFGERILVTATAPDGSTSEFSISVPLTDNLFPEILNSAYDGPIAPAITFEVSEGGITGVDPSDVHVESIPPGGPLEVVAAFFLEDQNRIKYILGATADGNYRATFQPNSIQDAAGNSGPPPGFSEGGNPRVVDFFIFAGDANRDRSINISDFAILAANFNREGFFNDGDFNYSGVVEIGDFAILASKFNTTLPAPEEGRAADRSAAAPNPLAPPGMFRAEPIERPVLEELR